MEKITQEASAERGVCFLLILFCYINFLLEDNLLVLVSTYNDLSLSVMISYSLFTPSLPGIW